MNILRTVFIGLALISAFVLASHAPTEESHLQDEGQDELVSICDHIGHIGRRRSSYMSTAEQQVRKIGAEVTLELGSVVLVGSTLLSDWCQSSKYGTVTAFITMMMLAKMGKCAMTVTRSFPTIDSEGISNVCTDDLGGVVRKLGLGDMILTTLIVIASGMAIAIHYPFCNIIGGSMPEDSKLALIALLIMNFLQFMLTSASLGTWCCAGLATDSS